MTQSYIQPGIIKSWVCLRLISGLFSIAVAVTYMAVPALSQGASNSASHSRTPAAPTQQSGIAAAWALYTQGKFAASADAFEKLIQTSSPNARLYYCAGLANREASRSSRSKQLLTYLVNNFSTTQEATYAKKLLPAAPAQAEAPNVLTSAASSGELPQFMKDSLTPEMRALVETPQGKEAVRRAFAQQTAMVKNAQQPDAATNAAPALRGAQTAQARKAATDHPFTADDIARDGANGIDQSRYPNCWFEASMSALAQLPRGQKLMASMIHYGPNGGYIVRFPNDGTEYKVSDDELTKSGIHDKALWASILECAEVQKFPNNKGAEGANEDQSRLEVGLGCITGARADVIMPGSVSTSELSTFIGAAVTSHNPIVAGTWNSIQLGGLPMLVVPQHAYTVTGFDPAKGLITIRNPHGQNAAMFSLGTDPHHSEFEQMNDGVFKMSLSLFQKYFHSIARSFI